MNIDKLIIGLAFFGILCLTALISQCTYNVSQCRVEAIKAGVKPKSSLKSAGANYGSN